MFRVVPGHRPRVFAGGFTNIIDIAFDKRGRLYVLEIATNGLLSAGENELPVGRLDRVNRHGRGAAYITNNSVFSDDGEVVKVDI